MGLALFFISLLLIFAFSPYEFIFHWICISLWQVEIKNQPQKVIHYHRYFERRSFSASGREGFPCMPVSWWQLPWVLFWEGSQSHELWSTGSATGPRLESGSMNLGRCHLRLSPVPLLSSLRNCGPEGRRDAPKSHTELEPERGPRLSPPHHAFFLHFPLSLNADTPR